MFKKLKKGQSALEYVFLLTILLGALLGTQNYLKRGVQGKWKVTIDDLGDQYDPRVTNSSLKQTLSSSTNTAIVSLNTTGGYWTRRTDSSVSSERKVGTSTVGAY